MTASSIRIRAPSRLHFGLLSFGGPGRQFGGVGVMIRQPALELVIRPRMGPPMHMSNPARMAATVARWVKYRRRDRAPACAIEIEASPPPHVGLGSGTQLALALAAGLDAFCNGPELNPIELAVATGRGRRSAVGTYGFVMGGMIVERGRQSDERLAPLECRMPLPRQWRFLLVRPTHRRGLSGAAEQTTFQSLPAVSTATREILIRLVRERIIPAVKTHDFLGFADAVHEYGRQAGNCFASCQGGPYNGPELTALVEQMRRLGLRGVGQSSWGPTLFALARSEEEARSARDALRAENDPEKIHVDISAPDDTGARIERIETRNETRDP